MELENLVPVLVRKRPGLQWTVLDLERNIRNTFEVSRLVWDTLHGGDKMDEEAMINYGVYLCTRASQLSVSKAIFPQNAYTIDMALKLAKKVVDELFLVYLTRKAD